MLTDGIQTAAEAHYGKSGELNQAMYALKGHSNVLQQAVQTTSDTSGPVSVCFIDQSSKLESFIQIMEAAILVLPN